MLKSNLITKVSKVSKKNSLTVGQRVADIVALTVGSWRFIIIQSTVIVIWIYLNVSGAIVWDAYPFILLNLAMSFQAAYTAPIIMMSQNRESERDRKRSVADFEINRLAEKEIEEMMQTLRDVQKKLDTHKAIKEDLSELKTELKSLKEILNLKN